MHHSGLWLLASGLVSGSPLPIEQHAAPTCGTDQPLATAGVAQPKRSPADVTRSEHMSVARADRLLATLRSLANQPFLVGRVLTGLGHDCACSSRPDSRRVRTSPGIGMAWRVV